MMARSCQPIRVLVVDDSALVRKTVSSLIDSAPDMTVVATACDGLEALEACARFTPDVVTLDISMPEMDGLTCLSHLVRDFRQPVVMLSTLALENSFPTFKALAIGAVDFVTKPGGGVFLQSVEEVGENLRAKIRVASAVPRGRIGTGRVHAVPTSVGETPREKHAPPQPSCPPCAPIERIIGVGGSTGGASGLELLLRSISPNLPVCVVAVQHLPNGFSASFARYLNTVSGLRVHEAENGQLLQSGCAYLAQGGAHLRVQRMGRDFILRTDPLSAPQHGYRPAIDQLFYSLGTAWKGACLGVLLSGMGGDGVGGLLALRRLGADTIVQDESTSVVFDMPSRAIAAGAARHVLPIDVMAGTLLRRCGFGAARSLRGERMGIGR